LGGWCQISISYLFQNISSATLMQTLFVLLTAIASIATSCQMILWQHLQICPGQAQTQTLSSSSVAQRVLRALPERMPCATSSWKSLLDPLFGNHNILRMTYQSRMHMLHVFPSYMIHLCIPYYFLIVTIER